MVPLKELQEWLLTAIRRTSGESVNHALVLALVESYQAVDAVELSSFLQMQKLTLSTTLDEICRRIEESCHYNIWCMESFTLVEGPYDLVTSHERLLQLRAQTDGASVRLAAGSESERRYLDHYASLKAKMR